MGLHFYRLSFFFAKSMIKFPDKAALLQHPEILRNPSKSVILLSEDSHRNLMQEMQTFM